MYKLAILASHPIQYQAPLFRAIVASGKIDLILCFKNKGSSEKPVYDKGFGRNIEWDIPLLQGYRSVFLEGFKDFSNIIDSFSPNALMVYGWGDVFNILAILRTAKMKIPVFICGETPLFQEKIKIGPLQFLKRYFLRKVFKKVSACLYIGEENKKFYEYMGVPRKKLFFTPYAVDNERFIKQETRNKQELKRGAGIGKNDVVVLFVGKFIPKKRPLDLLKAYELLSTKYQIPNTALVFVGDGQLRNELEKYSGDHGLKNVHFFGFKNQTELPEYYAMADIFVLPSGMGETWGLVVNEAMCFGLPIVVSHIVGCGPDLVHKGENGYVFRVGDTKELAEKIKPLLNNEKREAFGRRSLEIIKNYNFDRDIEGILKALQSIAPKTNV